MRKTLPIAVGVLLLIALLVPAAGAQTTSAEDVVKQYYTALADLSAGKGDISALADLFADDASVTIPLVSSTPVVGKQAMLQAFTGVFSLLKGTSLQTRQITTDGDKITVQYIITSADNKETEATDTFIIQEGKIKSLTINIATGSAPAQLPTTGASSNGLLLAGLAVLGLSMVVIGRKTVAA
jgi:LPXTG-motif cell wall-anchored protein